MGGSEVETRRAGEEVVERLHCLAVVVERQYENKVAADAGRPERRGARFLQRKHLQQTDWDELS